MKMKKVLLAATVLTAFAATAFAATTQNNDDQPSVKERVQSILHGDDQKSGPRDQGPRNFPPRPHLTDAEREQVKNMTPAERKAFFQEKHDAWVNNMSPEQKAQYEQHRKHMQERKAQHDKMVQEKMQKLTPEQRAEVEQFIKDDMSQRQAMGERLRKMTKDQQDAVKAACPKRFGKRGPKHMPKGPGPVMKDGHHDSPEQDDMMPPPPPMDAPASQTK